jgi:heterodisulfide reductase subunit C
MTEEVITIEEKSFKLADAVAAVGGIDVSFCYQCGKCSTGCPVAYAMDLTPTQLIHAMQLGLQDVVYKSNTMWLCASCLTCSTRCPQGVDIAEAFDTVKILMERTNQTPQAPDVLAVTKSFAQNLRWFGRMYELGMVAVIKLHTWKFTQDLGMGMKMLKKNKFNLLPRFEGARETRNIFRRVKKQEKA